MPTCAEICNTVDGCCSPDEVTWRKYMLQLLCCIQTNTGMDQGVDTEVELLCDPATGARVYVRYIFNQTDGTLQSTTAFNVDGTPYVGVIADLVACDDTENYVIQYPICDNGVQKFVRICFAGCVPTAPVYLNVDLTPAAAPVDFNNVILGNCPGTQLFVELGCLTNLLTGATRQIEIIKTIAASGAITLVYAEADGTALVPAITDVITLGQCPSDSPDRELICYVTTAQPNPQQAWARHDDRLIGVVAPNVDPSGIAYFTATNPVAALDLSQAGLQFVLCEGNTKVVEFACLTEAATGISRDIEIVKTMTPAGVVTTTYHELDGTVIVTMTADLISSGPCRNVTRCTTCRGGV